MQAMFTITQEIQNRAQFQTERFPRSLSINEESDAISPSLSSCFHSYSLWPSIDGLEFHKPEKFVGIVSFCAVYLNSVH